uniref:Uncharacterized protein n=1 Tax=viral metagenome TaxID=1070528 RepID=A0A6M3IK70_9ZZZZ
MFVPETIYPTGTIVKSCGGSFVMGEGKTLMIETSPAGEEYLNLTVPPGEEWTINMSIQIKIVNV